MCRCCPAARPSTTCPTVVRMPFSRIARIAAPVAALAVLVPLTGSVPTASASERHPTNAAKVFRWGNASVKDEFMAGWRSAGRSTSRAGRNQHGMLTLDSTRRSGTVTATRSGSRAATAAGRLASAAGSTADPVPPSTPSGSWSRAGPALRSPRIVLSDYALNGSPCARCIVRNVPNARVHRVEGDGSPRQPVPHLRHRGDPHPHLVVRGHQGDPHRAPFRAPHRAAYNVRFRLQAAPGASMRQGRMQMDWVRYYNLERKNAKSIKAPHLRHTSYAHAC